MKTLAIAFSMFSAIPMPQLAWAPKSMRYLLCAFPFVGMAVGGALLLWVRLAGLLAFGVALRAAGLTLAPILVTGGIHLDGFCDTADALASQEKRERKLEILKDPHCGAFAVIALGCYLLFYFAMMAELRIDDQALWILFLTPILSRAASAFAISALPCAKDCGLAHTFASLADRRTVRIFNALLFLLVAALLVWQGKFAGACSLLALLLILGIYRRMALRVFGGITGDLAGWFVQMAEAAALAGLLLGQRI